MEDTNLLTAAEVGMGMGMGGISDGSSTHTGTSSDHDQYEQMGAKQLTELKEFLKELEDFYIVDSFFTDMFGYNCSWHWHGFIRRINDDSNTSLDL